MQVAAVRQRLRRAIAFAATLVAVTVCILVLWFAGRRAKSEGDLAAKRAYDAGQWADAALRARQMLAVAKDDPSALRLLARSSARLGRDAASLAIYEHRLSAMRLEAEDYLLLGVMSQREGRSAAAARAWQKALEADNASPRLLEELTRFCVQGRHFEEAVSSAVRLSRQPAWEARGVMLLATIRVDLNNIPDAARLFRRAMSLDPTVVDKSHDPIPLRKVIARTFLRAGGANDARAVLQPIIDRAPDSEAAWLLSRAYLQDGEKARASAALKQAGTYRADNQLEAEPGLYVGEARCEKCHAKIFRESLTSRHTRTYYRGSQLDDLPRPGRALHDPDDPAVTHTIERKAGAIRIETRVGDQVFDSVIEYAFGTADRYLTMVGRDPIGRYRIARLSYFHTSEGHGWDRSTLDMTHPTRAHPSDFQGEVIGVRDGLAKCLYCHVTNPRTGHESFGPEISDRAIGCERCHGPGGNHIAALHIGFPDSAIVNPAHVSAQAVSTKQCNDCHVLEHNVRDDDDPENPGWVRSQGIGWARSRCNTESGGAFGCVTCHDPHRSAGGTSAADYEGKCLLCHSSRGQEGGTIPTKSDARPGTELAFKSCPVNPLNDCLGCHMPRVRIDSLHTALTDHYVRVRRRAN
jgi:Tfp pilus assembly protein PilF